MSHEQLLRLFIALDLPDNVRSTVATLQSRLKGVYGTGKFGKPVDFHLTLHFLGDTAVSKLPEVIGALSAVEMPVIDLKPEALTHMPDDRRPRVAAVRLGGDTAVLLDLHRRLGETIKPLGFRLDARPLKPHVTFARFTKPPSEDAIAKAHETAAAWLARAPAGRVGQFTLFQSTLDRDAARYAVLGRFPRTNA